MSSCVHCWGQCPGFPLDECCDQDQPLAPQQLFSPVPGNGSGGRASPATRAVLPPSAWSVRDKPIAGLFWQCVRVTVWHWNVLISVINSECAVFVLGYLAGLNLWEEPWVCPIRKQWSWISFGLLKLILVDQGSSVYLGFFPLSAVLYEK